MTLSLDHVAQTLLPVLLDASLKGALLLAGAGLIVTLLRRQPAAMRHLVWSLALIGCLVLPGISVLVPTWHVPLRWTRFAVPAPVIVEESVPASGALAELPTRVDRGQSPSAPLRMPSPPMNDATDPPILTLEPVPLRTAVPSSLSWRAWALVLWLAGAAMAIVPLALGIVSLRILRRHCAPLKDGFLTALVDLLAARLGIHRPIVLLSSARRTMPMTWGVRHPVILLPSDALDWSPQCLRVVLLHELAHIRRADCVIQFLAHFCRAIYWFNPLAWLAVRQLRAEQERACDDMVLNAGPSAPDYAEHLLAVTAGMPVSRFASPVALAMGRPRRIEYRLRMILDSSRDRRPLSRRTAVVCAFALATLLGPLAALSLQPAAAEPNKAPSNDACQTETSSPADDERIAEVRSLIIRSYVRPLKEQDLSDGAIRGMISALNDPYSEYLTQEQVEELGRGTQGTFAGVGIQLHIKDDQITVVTPIEGSPALQAGVRPGDAILAIDGQSTKGMDLPTAVKRILGQKGSQVILKLRHSDGEEAEVTLTRSQIKVPSVKGFRRGPDDRWQYMLGASNQIAYVAITHFTAATADDLRALLRQLKDQGLKGLVIDLRFSPGGFLTASTHIAELLIDKGEIVTIKGQNHADTTAKAEGTALIADVPIVVLLNEHTASAAEVLAGALNDNKRAILLGTRSYGKGSVQNLIKVPGDGVLRLTTAYFYLPSGRGIQKTPGATEWGVDPTDGYYFPLDTRQTETLLKAARELDAIGAPKKDAAAPPALTPKVIAEQYADPQLAAALETLTAKVTRGEFVPVGKPLAVMRDHLAKHEDLVKKRETLQKELDQINKQLGDPGKR